MTKRILQAITLLMFTAFCVNTVSYANEDYKYALALMKERKEYKNAADKFSNFVNSNPNSPDAPKALFYMASCLARLGKDNSAGSAYEQIIKLYPTADSAIIIDSCAYGADAYFRAELYKKASKLYEILLKNHPESKQVESSLYWLAECLNRLASAGEHDINNADYTASLHAYSELQKRFPTSRFIPDALTSAGLLAYSFKDYQNSSHFFSLYDDVDIELEPSKQELIIYHTAESLYWLKDYKAALKRFNSVIKNYPTGRYISESYAGAGWCSYSLGDVLAAAESFQQSANNSKSKPKALSAHFDAAAAFEEAGAKDRAIAEYTEVIKSDTHPKRQAALVRLGVLSSDNPNAETTKLLSEAFEPTSNDSDTSLSIEAGILLAENKLDSKKYTEAAAIFSKIVEISPKSEYAPFALYQLAQARAELKEFDKASTAIKLLLKNYPESPLRLQAAYAIADYQNTLGDTKKSYIAYKWLASQSEKWAEDYLKNHKVDNIEKFSKEAKDIAAASLLRLGESLYKDKNNPAAQEEAKDYFSDYITRYPNNPRLAAALLRLGELTESSNLKIAHTYFVNALNSANRVEADEASDKEFINIKMHAKYRLCINDILLSQRAEKTSAKNSKQYLKEGLQNINEFLSEYSSDPSAQELITHLNYYKSEVEYSLGDIDAALEGYDNSYQANKDSSVADAALFSSAWIEQEKGNTASAIQKLETLLANYKESTYRSNALYVLAVHSREDNDLNKASRYLTELLNKHPDSEFAAKALIEYAKINSLNGNYDESILKLTEFVTDNPKSTELPNAIYTLSWVYWTKISHIKDTDPDSKELTKLYTKVEGILKTLVTKYPKFSNNFIAKFRLGEIAYIQQDYNKAISWYKSTLGEPQDKLADKSHYRLAWCHLKLANTDESQQAEALKEFLIISKKFPNSSLFSESSLRAAKLLRQSEEYTRALKLYQEAEKKSKNKAILMGAIYGQGVTLLQLEMYSQASKVFKKYLTSYPDSPLMHEANWGAGQAALMLGASADATDYFNLAKENNYNGEVAAKARYGLGLIAMEKTEFKLAREEFRKVDVFHSEWQEVAAAALLKAAEASKELGETEPAMNDLQRIVQIYSNTSSAKAAEELLLSEAN